jgi:hypothetical protein
MKGRGHTRDPDINRKGFLCVIDNKYVNTKKKEGVKKEIKNYLSLLKSPKATGVPLISISTLSVTE